MPLTAPTAPFRTRYRERFEPTLDERPNLLAWYGTTRLFEPLSLIFRQNQRRADHRALLPVQPDAQHIPGRSCLRDTFRQAGLDRMSEAESLAYCEAAFAEDLQGHPLLSNHSTWFRYTIVKNATWSLRQRRAARRRACAPGHPSIGSGTRLAMQDAIALFEACQALRRRRARACSRSSVESAGAGSDSLQQAAIKSTEWYENLGPKLHLDPISFAYDYLRAVAA